MAVKGKKNIWGTTPSISQLQSEGGVAGSVHGALQTGTLMTTFTASQGLLLMVPNMYKIAGELMSFVMHVSARAIAGHGLSIFGDQTDVMPGRQTGFAMLCSNSAQEAHDMALVAHSATLDSRVPFLHFFDGFRTSHEVNTYDMIPDEIVREMIDYNKVLDIRARRARPRQAFHPRHRAESRRVLPVVGGAQFLLRQVRRHNRGKDGQARQAHRQGLQALPVRGRADAEKIIVIMGSGAETVEQTVKALNAKGEKLGVLKVRMFRPFSVKRFAAAIPQTAKVVTVLDRTKELGAMGEPLYQEVSASISEARANGLLPRSFDPVVLGGRYGSAPRSSPPRWSRACLTTLPRSRPRTTSRSASTTMSRATRLTTTNLSFSTKTA